MSHPLRSVFHRCRPALARAGLLLLALASAAALPTASWGHESTSSNDGGHGLMVGERWVMRHWAPFDERTAERALRLQPGQLVAFLYNDHHTIAQLARARGVRFDALVRRLAAWAHGLPAANRREVEQRIRLMLVGGHMPQHVFGHVFHGLAFTSDLIRATDLPHRVLAHHRGAGATYNALIRAAGNDPEATKRIVHQGIDDNAEAAVHKGHSPASQARRMADRQHRRVDCWFWRPAQTVDVAAPYGRKFLLHDPEHTAADVPRTRAEQRAEDRLIQQGRAGRPNSCWEVPPAFRGDPGAPLARGELRRLARLPAGYRGKMANAKGQPDTSTSAAGDPHAGH